MERIWAPWRMEFIRQAKVVGCIFCQHSKDVDDREALILQRGAHAFTMLNKYPYNSGHLMVIPYRHTDQLEDLKAATAEEIFAVSGRWTDILQQRFKAEGFNLGANLGRVAGAGVLGHFHFHIVPRWNGDTNFMPVLADTRVLPEYLHQTYDHLKAAWGES